MAERSSRFSSLSSSSRTRIGFGGALSRFSPRALMSVGPPDLVESGIWLVEAGDQQVSRPPLLRGRTKILPLDFEFQGLQNFRQLRIRGRTTPPRAMIDCRRATHM